VVNQITKELDDYLESRNGTTEDKKKKSRFSSQKYSKVPKMDSEYKTFVFNEEQKKPWYKRFFDWLMEDDSLEENQLTDTEEVEEKVSDEINKAEEELEELEFKQEQKTRNIFHKLLDKIRKIETEEIKDEYEVDEEHYKDLDNYKRQLNDDVRSSLKVIDKILLKISTSELEKIKETSDYQILEAIMHKYNLR